MADQRMIGDILSERRHSLGLSIDRVVSDTKLQRRMVEAFETSDFDAMPPKGYAQASLASYARYLGLNPNEILRVYDDQLYEYQRMSAPSSRSSNRRSGGDEPRRARSSSRMHESDDAYDYEREPERPSARRSTSSYRDRGAERPVSRSSRDDRLNRDDDRYAGRPYDRGLYDSGHRRGERTERPSSQRSSGRYDDVAARRPSSRSVDSYRDERPSDRYDRDTRDWERSAPAPAGGRTSSGRAASQKHTRGETQIVTLDDGYQGGSGGPESRDADIYRPRPARRTTNQRQSFSEVALGFVNSIKQDPRAFPIIIGVVAVTIIVVLVVSISSCVRGSGNQGQDNTIPVTPMAGTTPTATGTTGVDASQTAAQTTPLEPSLDLNNLLANTMLALSVSAEAPTGPWIEVYIDDVGVHAQITPPGTSLQWTVTRTATVKLSSIEYVQIFVNGTQVTPTLDNGTYVLTLNVAPDQQPQPEPEPAPEEGGEGGYYDEDGNWIEG